MSVQVWKYRMPALPSDPVHVRNRDGGIVTYPVPRDLRPVHFERQNGYVCMWAEVQTSFRSDMTMTLLWVGTGADVPASAKHVGTVIDEYGFVWHGYMRMSSRPLSEQSQA